MARKRISKTAPKAAANRSVVPIAESISQIPGYPDKLIIFKVPASPYWWMRTYDGKPIKRSTKTTDKREAIAAAKAFYDGLLLKKSQGIGTASKTSFNHCAEMVIAEDAKRVDQGQLSDTYATSQRGMQRNHIAKFFKGVDVTDIDYMMLDRFKNHLYGLNLVPASIKVHFSAVKKVLDYAQRANIIKYSPLLPRLKNEDNPRGYFNLKEYHLLRSTALRMIGTVSEVKQLKTVDGKEVEKKLRNIVVTRELLYLIPFMIYTFIRPSDIKLIQHQHITMRKGEDGDYLWMPIPKSKGHNKPITSMPRAAIFYRKLRQLRLRELGGDDKGLDGEYLFMPLHQNRKYAYRQLARQFDVVLKAAELKEGPMGEPRTLYSLRHTSLMYRVRYGGDIDTSKLAINARTSVEMLERFYLSKLESDHFTAVLHAKKPSTRKRKEASIVTTPAKPLDLKELMAKAREEIPQSARNKRLVAKDGKLTLEDGG
jgi:hypothetical protein